jgi:hypothetical protein
MTKKGKLGLAEDSVADLPIQVTEGIRRGDREDLRRL